MQKLPGRPPGPLITGILVTHHHPAGFTNITGVCNTILIQRGWFAMSSANRNQNPYPPFTRPILQLLASVTWPSDMILVIVKWD